MSGALQFFRTNTAPAVQPALYQLSIRAPGDAFGELMTYTFPITPSSIQYVRNALSTYAETQGPSQQEGITRQIDTFGLSPPMILIEGTTGWDFHSSDGFFITGLASMQLLKKILTTYASLNKAQQESGNPQMYTLEFYDFFQDEFWQVEPIGPQILRQSNDRALLSYYKYRLVASRPIGMTALTVVDQIATSLATAVGFVIGNTINTFTNFFSGYGPTGPL